MASEPTTITTPLSYDCVVGMTLPTEQILRKVCLKEGGDYITLKRTQTELEDDDFKLVDGKSEKAAEAGRAQMQFEKQLALDTVNHNSRMMRCGPDAKYSACVVFAGPMPIMPIANEAARRAQIGMIGIGPALRSSPTRTVLISAL